MNRTDLVDAYYDWLIEQIQIIGPDGREFGDVYSWTLRRLFSKDFIFFDDPHSTTRSYDQDRAIDGLELRSRFADEFEVAEKFWGGLMSPKCSILEMMIALAIRIENTYLWDPDLGDRTANWFWNMFENLGLFEYSNDDFDEMAVEEILDIFIAKKYGTDGNGGLFWVENCQVNMRNLDIWSQMNLWLNSNFE